MDDRIHLQIVTAKGVVYDGQASALNIPLDGGSIGVLADHAPLMGAVSTGVVEITHADGSKDYTAVGIGVVNVVENEVKILVRAAENAEDIDLDRAVAAEKRARERLENRTPDLDIVRAEAALLRAISRQNAAHMAKKRRP